MSPKVVDQICLLIAVVLPIPLVLWWNRIGVALGALVVWGSLIVSGILLAQLDPERGTSVLDSIWLLFGWIGGLLYCLPIYAVKRVTLRLWRGPKPPTGA